jgi:hypothetical protein
MDKQQCPNIFTHGQAIELAKLLIGTLLEYTFLAGHQTLTA